MYLNAKVAHPSSLATFVAITGIYSGDFARIGHGVGVEELGQDKLTPLLRLKYHKSIADALADLGRPDEIGRVFAGFQKYLYQQQAAA